MSGKPIPALDDPIGASLRGTHRRFSVRRGNAVRYHQDFAAFASVGVDPEDSTWDQLSELATPNVRLFLDPSVGVPDKFVAMRSFELVQMVDDNVTPSAARDDVVIDRLESSDADAVMTLVGRADPGPFERGTMELGSYFGIRLNAELVAMIGSRLSPPGWVEVSAVATDPRCRGRGFAEALINHLVTDIRSRGHRSFLHVAPNNPAIALYERMGFIPRREFRVHVLTSFQPAKGEP